MAEAVVSPRAQALSTTRRRQKIAELMKKGNKKVSEAQEEPVVHAPKIVTAAARSASTGRIVDRRTEASAPGVVGQTPNRPRGGKIARLERARLRAPSPHGRFPGTRVTETPERKIEKVPSTGRVTPPLASRSSSSTRSLSSGNADEVAAPSSMDRERGRSRASAEQSSTRRARIRARSLSRQRKEAIEGTTPCPPPAAAVALEMAPISDSFSAKIVERKRRIVATRKRQSLSPPVPVDVIGPARDVAVEENFKDETSRPNAEASQLVEEVVPSHHEQSGTPEPETELDEPPVIERSTSVPLHDVDTKTPPEDQSTSCSVCDNSTSIRENSKAAANQPQVVEGITKLQRMAKLRKSGVSLKYMKQHESVVGHVPGSSPRASVPDVTVTVESLPEADPAVEQPAEPEPNRASQESSAGTSNVILEPSVPVVPLENTIIPLEPVAPELEDCMSPVSCPEESTAAEKESLLIAYAQATHLHEGEVQLNANSSGEKSEECVQSVPSESVVPTTQRATVPDVAKGLIVSNSVSSDELTNYLTSPRKDVAWDTDRSYTSSLPGVVVDPNKSLFDTESWAASDATMSTIGAMRGLRLPEPSTTVQYESFPTVGSRGAFKLAELERQNLKSTDESSETASSSTEADDEPTHEDHSFGSVPPPPPPPLSQKKSNGKKKKNEVNKRVDSVLASLSHSSPPPPPSTPPPQRGSRRKKNRPGMETVAEHAITPAEYISPVAEENFEFPESPAFNDTPSPIPCLEDGSVPREDQPCSAPTDTKVLLKKVASMDVVLSSTMSNEVQEAIETAQMTMELSELVMSSIKAGSKSFVNEGGHEDSDAFAWLLSEVLGVSKTSKERASALSDIKHFNAMCAFLSDAAGRATSKFISFRIPPNGGNALQRKALASQFIQFLNDIGKATGVSSPCEKNPFATDEIVKVSLESEGSDIQLVQGCKESVQELVFAHTSTSPIALASFARRVHEAVDGVAEVPAPSEALSREQDIECHPSPFEQLVEENPLMIGRILSFLGDPVAVSRVKTLNKACYHIIDDNEHILMRDAVRLGGISMSHRPSFWLWITLDRCKGMSSDDGDATAGDFDAIAQAGKDGRWSPIIERDVQRAFGNLPPHKSGARIKRDSIVRAMVTYGRNRMMKRGVKGYAEPPVDDNVCDEADDATPTDTVSDWGGVTPVGSFASGSVCSGYEEKKRNDMEAEEEAETELALGGNLLTDDNKLMLQDKLRSILNALAATHKDVGYCQGMDYVVAHLLRILQDTIRWKAAVGSLSGAEKYEGLGTYHAGLDDEGVNALMQKVDTSPVVEETCFRVMNTLFTTYNLQHFYWPELRCLKTCCLVFEKLIKAQLPVLADHFEHHELNVGLFALGWFQTLFLYLPSMPSATVCHIWDIWLVERSFKIFFRVGTAILFLSQPTLLNLELEGMMSYLNTFPDATLLSPDILIACALQIKVTNQMLMDLEHDVSASM